MLRLEYRLSDYKYRNYDDNNRAALKIVEHKFFIVSNFIYYPFSCRQKYMIII